MVTASSTPKKMTDTATSGMLMSSMFMLLCASRSAACCTSAGVMSSCALISLSLARRADSYFSLTTLDVLKRQGFVQPWIMCGHQRFAPERQHCGKNVYTRKADEAENRDGHG